MKLDIIVTSSKGDNFVARNVMKIECDDKFLTIDSQPLGKCWDKIPRDRSIELVNVEVEDIGF